MIFDNSNKATGVLL